MPVVCVDVTVSDGVSDFTPRVGSHQTHQRAALPAEVADKPLGRRIRSHRTYLPARINIVELVLWCARKLS